MKIALVGSSGYIAGFLVERFGEKQYEILKIDQSERADVYLNLQRAGEFNYELLDSVDFVVFTAAVSGPDKCVSEFDLCWSINVIGTSAFVKEAIRRGCKVLFFSSDAVFGDVSGMIYDEQSPTEACTAYGRMKKTIEDEFKGNNQFKALRISYVVSAKDRFVSYCLDCIKKNEEADIFHPFYRNCIAVSDVVNVVIWFLNHWDEYDSFVLNVTGNELVSRVRIADEINRIMDGKLKYSISTPGGNFYKNRPKITQMRSLYLYKYGILKEESFTEKIQRELGDMRRKST